MRRPLLRSLGCALAGGVLALTGAGCAATSLLHHRPGAALAAADPSVHPAGPPADPRAVAVIRAWARALRRGDVAGAAGLFALPSRFANGSGSTLKVVTIRTAAEAFVVNATLPCGALLLSAVQRGRFVDALFRLTGRGGTGGGPCAGGAGQTARTAFLIRGGRIVEWIRAPAEPGDDPHAPGTPRPEPPSSGVSVI